ncbi:MAG: DUF4129 domain-containing protein [Gemmatimonadales bacterium]
MIEPTQAISADSLRAVLRQVFASSEYQWEVRRDPLQFLRDAFARVVTWLQQLEAAHPVAYWALVGMMVVLLVAIVVHVGYVLVQVLRPAEGRRAGAATSVVVRDAAWHLREAQRLAANGRYAEALGHRFTALLLDLDRRNLVRFDASKTPAEYLDEAELDEPGRGAMRTLVSALYRHVFGGAPCTADDVDAFHRLAGTVARHRVAA